MATKDKKEKRNKRNKRKKKEFSKVIIFWVLLSVIGFIVFYSYEAHRLGDLSAVEYLTDILKYLAVVSVGGYFWKAKNENLMRTNLEYTKEMNEMKKHYGDGFIVEEITPTDD